MAAALLHHYAKGTVLVRSAGSAPADSVNPAAIQGMAELELDLTQEFPKPLTTDAVHAADVVITMGCGDACPIFPGKLYLDWQLDDPAGQDTDTVRAIRDEIDRRVRALLAELVPTPARPAAPPGGFGWPESFERAPDHQPPHWPDPHQPQQFHLDVMVEDVTAAEPQVLTSRGW